MKIYMMTDLEGVAGVFDWEDRKSQDPYSVLFAGGATEVIVNDGHGAGYTIDFELLDPRAQVIHGLDRPFWLPLLDDTCDATCLVGGHAKAGTEHANLCHTMSGVVRGYWINGVSLGEMGLQALIAGHYGVPMTFVSGDWYACREMSELIPGIVTAPVKKGLSLRSAVASAPHKAREMIRDAAQTSMKHINEIKPFTLDTPLTFREEFYEPRFDPEQPPEVGTIIDPHTREVKAANVIELINSLYGYPR